MDINKNNVIDSRIRALSKEKQDLLLKKLGSANIVAPEIQRQSRSVPVQASYTQRNLWLAYKVEGAGPKYNMFSAYKLKGKLNVELMKNCFNIIVQRHESLRTVFEERNGEVFQIVKENMQSGISVFSAHGLSENNVFEITKTAAPQVFDLERGPLFHIQIVELSANCHVLMMNMHHIIYDGWSKGLLLKELLVLYKYGNDLGTVNVSEIDSQLLPQLPIQYRDYTSWVNNKIDYETQLDYWKNHLSEIPQYLNLPTDRPRSHSPSIAAEVARVKIDAESASALERIAREASATSYMAMLTVFSILLSRLSGERDILVGTPLDNRGRHEVQNLIGYFLDTSVFRNKIDLNYNFLELLKEVKAECIRTYTHQGAPWDEIIRAVNPVRSTAHTPIFQVMLVFQNGTSHQFSLPDLEIEKIDSGTNTTKYDIYLTLNESSSGLEGWLTYNADLFSSSRISRFIDCLCELIKQVTSKPNTAVGLLPIISASQMESALMYKNNSAEEITPMSIQHVFLRQVDNSPDAIALISEGNHISYRSLNVIANKLLTIFIEQNIKPGDVIGLHMERSIELVAATLALYKLGAIYLPLDPLLPVQRLMFMIENAGAAGVICTRFLASNFEHINLLKIVIDINELDATNEALSIYESSPNDIAYVMYTSGSTGTPKGVVGRYQGILNRLSWMAEEFPIGEDEVCCLKTSINFVDSVAELWGPLLQGRPAVILSHDKVIDLFEFVQTLAKCNVTRLVVVPSLLRALLDHYPDLSEILPQLKVVISSGEELQADLAARFKVAHPDCRLINLYGSTEVSADATCYVVDEVIPDERIPIGKPIKNTQIYILDTYMNICPVGVPGDLYVGGDCLAMGYHANARTTAERYIPDSFSGKEGQRLFKTGDLARLREDGNIEYIGRDDSQVKVRGFRIELGEVEAAMLDVNQVIDAVCVADKRDPENTRILGYVVIEDGAELGSSQIKNVLLENLPNYMIPSHITVLDEIPLLSNGKVDRRNLPLPDENQEIKKVFVEPSTPAEHNIVKFWKAALKLERVSTQDNFFDLGGHSLAAIKVIAAIRKEYSLEISPREIFELRTIKNIALHIDGLLALKVMVNDSEKNKREDEVWDTIEF